MKRVFLSYRRADRDWVELIARGIFDELALGDLFWDRDPRSLPGATKWQDRIDEAIRESLAMVIAIGPHWFGDEERGRRIDQADDPVRNEIALGLQRNLLMFPLVATGIRARLESESLPPDLKPLLAWQMISVSDPPTSEEMNTLLVSLVDTFVKGRRSVLASFTLGNAARSGQVDDVMATARLAVRRDPNDAIALRAFAACCLARYDYAAARDALARALHSDPSDAESRHLYALARLAGRSPSVISDAEVSAILDVIEPGGQPLDDLPHHRALLAFVKWDYFVPRGRETRGALSDFSYAERAVKGDPEIDALVHLPAFRQSLAVDRLGKAVASR